MCSFLHVNICVSSSRLETKIFAFGVLFELNKSCPSSIDGTASLMHERVARYGRKRMMISALFR